MSREGEGTKMLRLEEFDEEEYKIIFKFVDGVRKVPNPLKKHPQRFVIKFEKSCMPKFSQMGVC